MDFDTTMMLQVADRIAPAPGLITQLLIGDKIVYSDTSKVDQDFYNATKKLSPVVDRMAGGKVVSKTSWNNYQFQTPYCAPVFNLDSELLEKRMPGESVVGGMSITEREDAWKAKKIAEGKAMAFRRVEWMGATLLSTGKYTIEGEGYTDEIDIGHTQNETLAAGVKWNTAGGDPLADLERWQATCLANGGVLPNICVMGTAAAGAFRSNDKVMAAMDTRNYELGKLEPTVLPAGAVRLGYIGLLDLTVYVHGGQYESDAGVMTPYIAADRVVLFPGADRNSAHLVYGAVRDVELEQWFMVDVYPRYVKDVKANSAYLEVISRPLVVFVETEAFYWADVV